MLSGPASTRARSALPQPPSLVALTVRAGFTPVPLPIPSRITAVALANGFWLSLEATRTTHASPPPFRKNWLMP